MLYRLTSFRNELHLLMHLGIVPVNVISGHHEIGMLTSGILGYRNLLASTSI
jgi:hypothetical protein